MDISLQLEKIENRTQCMRSVAVIARYLFTEYLKDNNQFLSVFHYHTCKLISVTCASHFEKHFCFFDASYSTKAQTFCHVTAERAVCRLVLVWVRRILSSQPRRLKKDKRCSLIHRKVVKQQQKTVFGRGGIRCWTKRDPRLLVTGTWNRPRCVCSAVAGWGEN